MINYVVTTVLGHNSKTHYLIRKWDDGTYSWEFELDLDTICKDGYLTKADAIRGIQMREDLLNSTDSVYN